MPSLTLAMSTVVAAAPARVWSALVDPDEALRWRPGALAVVPPQPGELAPGRVLRLRCHIGGLPVTLEETTLEVAPEARLHSALRVGLFRCAETFTLTSARTGGGTRVALRVVTTSEAPLVGESLDRFGVRRFAVALASDSLSALRRCCEPAPTATHEPGARPRPQAREAV